MKSRVFVKRSIRVLKTTNERILCQWRHKKSITNSQWESVVPVTLQEEYYKQPMRECCDSDVTRRVLQKANFNSTTNNFIECSQWIGRVYFYAYYDDVILSPIGIPN